jgi:GDP-L-fucose synthase
VSSAPLNESKHALVIPFELAGKRVFVAGHTGMAGSAIVRRLRQEGCSLIIPDRSELDLTRQDQTERYLFATRPEIVIMAAGRVGGILANDQNPAEFLADNLAMAFNCIHVSHLIGVKKSYFWDLVAFIRELPSSR